MTVSCGLTRQPFFGWFAKWDLVATTLWAAYAGLLGFFVAGAVENQATAIWLAFGVALGITFIIEVGRFILERVRGPKSEEESSVVS